MLALIAGLYLPLLQKQENSLLVLPKVCKLFSSFGTKERFDLALVVQESVINSGKTDAEKRGLFKTLVQLFQQYLTLVLLEQESGKPTSPKIIETVQTLAIFCNFLIIKLLLMNLISLYHILTFIMKLWKKY
jgi:hypothetical protein